MFTDVNRELLLGSLSNDDGDGNKNGKKAMGLDWQNNNFSRASGFSVYFLAVVARLLGESASFHVLSRTGTQNNNFRIQLLKLINNS